MAKKVTPRGQIKEGAKVLEELMLEYLEPMAQGLIAQIMAKAKRLTPSQRLRALADLAPAGVREYRAALEEALAALANDALALARKEVPKAKNVKLGELDKLSADLQRKVKSRAGLMVESQVADLQKSIEFAYSQNEDTTDSIDIIRGDLADAAEDWLDGTSLAAGATMSAATIVSQAREAFFFDPEVIEEIEAFQFVNGDPTSPICQDMAGTVFSKDDPDLFRYTPPLHWNCKSYISPILNGNLGNRDVEKLRPSTRELEKSIQFSDRTPCSGCAVHRRA